MGHEDCSARGCPPRVEDGGSDLSSPRRRIPSSVSGCPGLTEVSGWLSKDAWLARLVEHRTLDLVVRRWSPRSGGEMKAFCFVFKAFTNPGEPGARLAQSVERVTRDCGVASLSPTLGAELSFFKNAFKTYRAGVPSMRRFHKPLGDSAAGSSGEPWLSLYKLEQRSPRRNFWSKSTARAEVLETKGRKPCVGAMIHHG